MPLFTAQKLLFWKVKIPLNTKRCCGELYIKLSFTDFGLLLEICGCTLNKYFSETQTDSVLEFYTCGCVICLNVCYLCSQVARSWHETGQSEEWFNLSQYENGDTFFSFPFIWLPKYSHQRARILNNEPIIVYLSVFWIWGGDKPVMVTHRPTYTMLWLLPCGLRCMRVWNCVGWPGVLSLAPHPFTSLKHQPESFRISLFGCCPVLSAWFSMSNITSAHWWFEEYPSKLEPIADSPQMRVIVSDSSMHYSTDSNQPTNWCCWNMQSSPLCQHTSPWGHTGIKLVTTDWLTQTAGVGGRGARFSNHRWDKQYSFNNNLLVS